MCVYVFKKMYSVQSENFHVLFSYMWSFVQGHSIQGSHMLTVVEKHWTKTVIWGYKASISLMIPKQYTCAVILDTVASNIC